MFGNLAAPLISFKRLSVSPFIGADSDPQGDQQCSNQLVHFGSVSGSSKFTSMRIRLCRLTFTLPSFSFLKFFSVLNLSFPRLKYIHVPYRCGRYKKVSEKIGITTSVKVFIFVDFVATGSGRIADPDP